jgi:hypothetical protein
LRSKVTRSFWDRYLHGPREWFDIWNHWGALHYQQILQFGYAATGVTKSFYPLFPWSIRLLRTFEGVILVRDSLPPGIASIIAAVLLRRVVQLGYAANVGSDFSYWFNPFGLCANREAVSVYKHIRKTLLGHRTWPDGVRVDGLSCVAPSGQSQLRGSSRPDRRDLGTDRPFLV